MIHITDSITLDENEIQLDFIRASGPGGQNVNKVSSAIHLRFDIPASSALTDEMKARLLAVRDHRISAEGIINIKAQRSRSREKNRLDALNRLAALLEKSLVEPKARKRTKPSKKAKEKRLADKSHRAKIKQTRSRIVD